MIENSDRDSVGSASSQDGFTAQPSLFYFLNIWNAPVKKQRQLTNSMDFSLFFSIPLSVLGSESDVHERVHRGEPRKLTFFLSVFLGNFEKFSKRCD